MQVVPKTAENFYQLCTRAKCGYQGTRFHRVIPGFMVSPPERERASLAAPLWVAHVLTAPCPLPCELSSTPCSSCPQNQGGQTCGPSIYGARFDDENFDLKFAEPYLLGMANGGANTNAVDFFITVAPAPHLDGKFVVFGT